MKYSIAICRNPENKYCCFAISFHLCTQCQDLHPSQIAAIRRAADDAGVPLPGNSVRCSVYVAIDRCVPYEGHLGLDLVCAMTMYSNWYS